MLWVAVLGCADLDLKMYSFYFSIDWFGEDVCRFYFLLPLSVALDIRMPRLHLHILP
jgi:hypothetical protein